MVNEEAELSFGCTCSLDLHHVFYQAKMDMKFNKMMCLTILKYTENLFYHKIISSQNKISGRQNVFATLSQAIYQKNDVLEISQ